MLKRAVIWDMDGVIVDTEEYHFRAWREMLREQGIELTKADFKRTFGMRNADLLTLQALVGLGADAFLGVLAPVDTRWGLLLEDRSPTCCASCLQFVGPNLYLAKAIWAFDIVRR